MIAFQALNKIISENGKDIKQWKVIVEKTTSSEKEASCLILNLSGKLHNSHNEENMILLLNVVDFIMDKGSFSLRKQISERKFLTVLNKILGNKDLTKAREKVLFLISKWYYNYSSQPNLYQNIISLYEHLKSEGITFPRNLKSNYPDLNRASSNREVKFDKKGTVPNQNKQDYSGKQPIQKCKTQKENEENVNNMNYSKVIGDKIRAFKFISNDMKNFLIDIAENISSCNELIDNYEISKNAVQLNETLGKLNKGNTKLINILGSDKINDEKLMEFMLGISDDINRTLSRYKILNSKKKPSFFISSFMKLNLNDSPDKNKNSGVKSKYNSNNNNNWKQEYDNNRKFSGHPLDDDIY